MIVDIELALKKKSRELVTISCNYCGENHDRLQKNVIYSRVHYCNSKCQGQHRRETLRDLTKALGEKSCIQCGNVKPLDEFNKNKSKADGLNNFCRECGKENSKKYYKKNGRRYKEKGKTKERERTTRLRQNSYDYLKVHPCVDCGNDNPIVLEYDHKDGVEKVASVSSMISSAFSWKNIEKEIDKCDVRCSNCHKIRTAEQLGYYKGLIL